MSKLVECIPNFSCSKEKDEAAYNALVEVANSVPGCTLFDAQTDGNHNRCVFTMIGSPEAIEEVAFQLTKKASEVIDMTKHVGEHSPHGRHRRHPLRPHHGRHRGGVRGDVQASGPADLGRAEDPQLPV